MHPEQSMKTFAYASSLLLFLFNVLNVSCRNTASNALSSQGSVDHQIELFNSEHLYFQQNDNKRTVVKTHLLPSENAFDTVILTFDLSCPNNLCDWWDRSGELSIINENGEAYELLRFKTPYRVGATWSVDISDFLPLLHGKKDFAVFIDTWVKPGSPQGDGWLVTAKLDYKRTNRAKKATEVIPVFTPRNEVYGESNHDAQLSKRISASKSFQSARLLSYITGHGQGNTENCAEFCPKHHMISIADKAIEPLIWRDDCNKTVTKGPQMGTWQYSRAGWCPGDKVDPILLEIDNLPPGHWQVTWKPEAYENELNKDYDQNGHTEPFYRVSSYLVLYEHVEKVK